MTTQEFQRRSTLSIFLSFRNNACYDRWWEARRQWGAMVGEMRAIGRETAVQLAGEEPAVRRRVVDLRGVHLDRNFRPVHG